MNAKDLIRLGVSEGASIKLGMDFIVKFIGQGGDPSCLEEEVAAIIANPATFLSDPLREPSSAAVAKRCASSFQRMRRLWSRRSSGG